MLHLLARKSACRHNTENKGNPRGHETLDQKPVPGNSVVRPSTRPKVQKSKRPIGPIVGGAVGGISLIAILIVFALNSPFKDAASQDAPKQAASGQPTPGQSGQKAVPKDSHLSARKADTRVSTVAVTPAVTGGPVLSQAVAWMRFSPSGKHLFVLPAGQNKGLLWTVPGWQETKADSSRCNYFSVPVVFSHDGKFLACQDGDILRIWNITTSPATLANSVPAYSPGTDDPSWNGIVWANDGTLVARNPEGGFQFLNEDPAKGAVLIATVGSGKHGLLQLGNKHFAGDSRAPGTLQVKNLAVAPTGGRSGHWAANKAGNPASSPGSFRRQRPSGFSPSICLAILILGNAAG